MTTPERFPSGLPIQDFHYDLPDEKIARFPLPSRDASKLLIWKSGHISESYYARIAEELPSGCTLLFNDSKVIGARLIFIKPSGGEIEIFCLEPLSAGEAIQQAMLSKKKMFWKCLIGGASKWKRGSLLEKEKDGMRLQARFVEKTADYFIVEFQWLPAEQTFAAVLQQMGSVPLPPYLKRNAEASDRERYQTIYAREEGSVAAPTAGLHFTENIFKSLEQKNIHRLQLTLHVGAGTFMPVKAEHIGEHRMHEENIEIHAALVEQLIQKLESPLLAVGTTSLRVAESLYWLGVKISGNNRISADELQLHQWDPYRLSDDLPVKTSLTLLLEWLEKQPQKKCVSKTQLFVAPGYRFKLIRGLITNFHQPQSTLLLLVAALIGDAWKTVYRFALDHDYRFLSYGDGCLLMPDERNFDRK